MKKFLFIILTFSILIIGGILLYNFTNKNNFWGNYSANKSSLNVTNNSISNNKKTITEEIEIGNFSTKIKNKKDLNRQGNITISCDKLNNTEIKPGEIFSFCNTVGKATKEKGYKEANIIVNGEEIKGVGGGNCQISSTLYNAVTMSNELEVVERHPHSAPVPYIESGKDAAVSYGVHDFKFKNNSSSTVKILAENTADDITIKIVKLIVKDI